MIREKNYSIAAILFRSLAIAIILYQFRLIAGDMADTPVFIAALAAAFAAACFFAAVRRTGKAAGEKRLNTAAALVAIALVPWISRAFIIVPRLFVSHNTGRQAIALDSLLLNLDRNNFVSLLPFYWAAVTTWFSIRSRKFLRAAVIADTALLVVVYSIVRAADISLYRWPVIMIFVFAGVIFLQALAFLFSLPRETKPRTAEIIPAVLILIALIFVGGALFLGPAQKRAMEKGGGLLQPQLFSFDFSQFLRLDSEISMNDDLVLIVKKESDDYDDHVLLRRSALSGYSRKQGFFRIEELDERAHPQRLPDRTTELFSRNASTGPARQVRQEYFIVNFDAAAFIGMNEPVSVTPYESWDASSFKSAYKVESLVSAASPRELFPLDEKWPGAAELGLSAEEFNTYTEYGGDERIRAFAEEITQGIDSYGDKIKAIHNRLKYGEYRYSLKPGIAPDGDQLSWFLFEAKKGYCSYYAFAMTLLARSLGIPARLTAGFFIDPMTNTFNYYPVRSDMAHAWVEVLVPGHGWIEFDPTSETLAEDEEFRFSSGVDPELFAHLMREIFENRNMLREKKGTDAEPVSPAFSLAKSAADFLRNYWFAPLLVVIALLWIYIRCGYFIDFNLRSNKRKKAARLWKHCRRRLRLAGIAPDAAVPESEWAHNAGLEVKGTYEMYTSAAAARFAPAFTGDDFLSMRGDYRVFCASYKEAVPFRRRLAAWLLPPLALILRRGKNTKRKSPSNILRCALPVLFLLLFLAGDTKAQNAGQPPDAANVLYDEAMKAARSEYWERAIDLLRSGQNLYPDDIRFPWSLGKLYYERSLYTLAWDEYLKAEKINPLDVDVLFRLARTAGYLNLSARSADYFERILLIDPENKEAISNLGWMYYKIHRLDDGETLLRNAIDRFGDDADLAMTLGTIYSSMYNYDQGKYWYKKAISAGKSIGDNLFTAVAHYNLSILESRFYHFDLSMDETNASLNLQTRASGLLARGELNQRRLNLRQAQSDFQAAYAIDTSPLAKLNLAMVYQISGRLDEAMLYAQDCLEAGEFSWMLNYGIDPDRYKRDIHSILHETYKGLARLESFTPRGKTKEKLFSFFKGISYRFKAAAHNILYRKYSLAAADAYYAEIDGEELTLDAYIQYFSAFENYPRRAAMYLNRARELETAMIPAAVPSYDFEEGILSDNKNLVTQALANFDPRWENELISQCYRELAHPEKGGVVRSRIQQTAAEEFFALNRGGLLQAGISLPVEINIDFNSAEQNMRGEKRLRKVLNKSGFADMNNTPENPVRFQLNITINKSAGGYTASSELLDTQGEGQTLRHSFSVRDFSMTAIGDFVRALDNAVFKVSE